jgi:hypothetical protein
MEHCERRCDAYRVLPDRDRRYARRVVGTACGGGAHEWDKLEVAGFDETAKIILANGGVVAVPKMAILGRCRQGYFFGTDKNVFGIFEVNKAAK